MNSTAGSTVRRAVMAVGAHADDIEAHAGGTLLKFHSLGYEVIYVMATNNMSGQIQTPRPDGGHDVASVPPGPMMALRRRECGAAAARLGTTAIHLDHPQRHYTPDNGTTKKEVRFGTPLAEGIPADVPTILTAAEDPASVAVLSGLIRSENPECILTHGIAQANIEHFATALLVGKAYWAAVDAGYEGGLLHWREAHTLHGDFNCRWETHVDYGPWLDQKMALIRCHESQMPDAEKPDFGHRMLSRWYGKACGCTAAEAYTWVRRPSRRDSTGPVHGELGLELLQNTR